MTTSSIQSGWRLLFLTVSREDFGARNHSLEDSITRATRQEVNHDCRGCAVPALCSCARLESITDVTHQRFVRKRLLQKARSLALKTVMASGVIGIAGHIENLNPGADRDDLSGEFRARHSRHDDVRQEHIQCTPVFRRNFQRLRTGFRDHYFVSSVAKNFHGHFSQCGIVLHEEYRFSTGTEIKHFLHDFWMSRPCNARQQSVESASLAGLAFHPDISSALFHNA